MKTRNLVPSGGGYNRVSSADMSVLAAPKSPEHRELLTQFMNLKPILIGGTWRSGTTLLQRLFDGHPQLLVYPYEDCILRSYYRKWGPDFPDLFRRRVIASLLTAHNSDALFEEMQRSRKLAQAVREHPNAGAFRFHFTELLRCGCEDDSGGAWTIEAAMRAWIAAYFLALGVTDFSSFSGWVSKSPENGYFSSHYPRCWPTSTVIQLIRDPRSVHASVLRRNVRLHPGVHGHKLLSPLLRTIDVLVSLRECRQSFINGQRAVKAYPRQCILLRYEDLVSDPYGTMKQLAYRTQIDVSPTLLVPTVNGQPWMTNSSFATESSALRYIDGSQSQRWRSELHPLEKSVLSWGLRNYLRDFGYSRS